MTEWEYARIEYTATGSFGNDKAMDYTATFYHPGGAVRWGTDERFNDLKHLNRAGKDGWQAYDRAVLMVGAPARIHAVAYSLKRPVS